MSKQDDFYSFYARFRYMTVVYGLISVGTKKRVVVRHAARPDIEPIWCRLMLLYGMSKVQQGLITVLQTLLQQALWLHFNTSIYITCLQLLHSKSLHVLSMITLPLQYSGNNALCTQYYKYTVFLAQQSRLLVVNNWYGRNQISVM